METRLNALSLIIDSLQERVSDAKDRKDISTLEVDIILDLLRQAYLKAEELKKKHDIHLETVRTPVVQVIQPPLEKEEKEEKTPVIARQVKEEVSFTPEPVTEETHYFPEPENKEVPFIQDTLKQEVPFIPEPVKEPEPQEIEVPQMTFEPVEITLDLPVEAPPIIVREEPVYTPEPVVFKEEPAAPVLKETIREQPAPKPVYAEPEVNTPKQRKADHHEADLFGAQTIADKFKKETPSLNERITQGRGDQSLAHKMQLKPISDLKTAIGINEKFQFVNDLFDGSIESYNEAITNLNNCTSGLVAENILVDLQLKNDWNESSEAYGKLKTFITRRYL